MHPYQESDLLRYKNQPFKLFDLDYTELVYVGADKFIMGDNILGYEHEKPETEITFDKGYFIGKYPVTQQLYEAVTGTNPSNFKGNYRPVESVSHDDICKGNNSFLAKLNEKIQTEYPNLQGTFGLPSEAQWEYAARGGQYWDKPKLTYAGSENLNDVGWYEVNSNTQTMPVGLKQPNALGLYDMSGNVYEWCADWYTENYQQTPKNGSPYIEQGTLRILRGGSCFDHASYCQVTSRDCRRPGYRIYNIGFRLVFPSLADIYLLLSKKEESE